MFDLADENITEKDIIDIVMGEDGRVVILTPEVVNGGIFNISVIASDDPGATEGTTSYPISADGMTVIDEVDMTKRFFRVSIGIAP